MIEVVASKLGDAIKRSASSKEAASLANLLAMLRIQEKLQQERSRASAAMPPRPYSRGVVRGLALAVAVLEGADDPWKRAGAIERETPQS